MVLMVVNNFTSEESGVTPPAGGSTLPPRRRLLSQVFRLTRVWLMFASRAAQAQLLNHWGGLLFLLGKVIRFLLFFVFLFTVLSSTKNLAGYNREQVIVFFLVFNLMDIVVQFLFRGVYHFRSRVVSGDYDLDLLKPLPSFFRPIFGWTDILDFITLVPLSGYFFWFLANSHFLPGFSNLIVFLILLLNGLILSFAFHLFVSSICVLTTEIDHLVWVYRDLTSMARFPTDIYQKGMQAILTFVVPVVILVTVPAKALLGIFSWQGMIWAIVVSLIALVISLKFWYYSLRRYSSASS